MSSSPFICGIHGAGGGAWEFDLIWGSCFQAAGLSLSSITLEPCSQGIEHTSFHDYTQQVIHFISERKSDNHQPVVLIGASMGAILAIKVAELSTFQINAMILICPVPPLEAMLKSEIIQSSFPSIIRWANSLLQETIDSMPDATEDVCIFASERWRDESGLVLNTILNGVSCVKPTCPILVVIPDDDETVSPSSQRRLAEYLSASTLECVGGSHVGPLLGANASQIAGSVIEWLQSTLL